MIRFNPAKKTYDLHPRYPHTPEEVAELDSKYQRVAPGDLRWFDPADPPPAPARGLGDVVERLARPVAKALGIQGCGGCKGRQEALNKLVPFQRAPYGFGSKSAPD